ncbi:serine/threonine-protein kinase [Haliangium sp.]|uniref:serine/threonine-protein kinase n=1 Tax=Haliangium sp. TaxID=2663208 RepID=UPI003D12A9F1
MGKLSQRLGRRMGVGGSAEVFQSTLPNGRRVAVKRLVDGAGDQQPLLREAELAAALDHPNIVSVLDVQRERDGRVYLVLEHVDGVALARLLKVGPLPVEAAVYVAVELLAALDHAHNEVGIVHRDVSPHNVLVARDGAVKLADFEIAKPIDSGPTTGTLARGTPGYLSPEHLDGATLDARSDLFSVGVLLYEALTAQKPFGHTREQIIARLFGRKAPTPVTELRPEVPAELGAVVARLIERERGNRYATARDALRALPPCPQGRRQLVAYLSQHRLIEDTPSGPSYRLAAPTPARVALVPAACIVVGLALGMAGQWLAADSSRPAEPPEQDSALLEPVPHVERSTWLLYEPSAAGEDEPAGEQTGAGEP